MKKDAVTDFIGFIDGFEARNLESIRKQASAEINDMQTRAQILKELSKTENDLKDFHEEMIQIEMALSSHVDNVVQRISKAGELLYKFMQVVDVKNLKTEGFNLQIRGFIKSFMAAAEICKDMTLVKEAVNLGEIYQEKFGES